MAVGQTNAKTSSISIDGALSDTSENPVKNKVVKAALDGVVSNRSAAEPAGGDAMLFYDASAGANAKLPLPPGVLNYRVLASGSGISGKNIGATAVALTETYDPRGLLASNQLTAPAAGTFLLRLMVSSGGYWIAGHLYLLKNGTVVKTWDGSSGPNSYSARMVADAYVYAVSAAAGDKLRFELSIDTEYTSNEYKASIELQTLEAEFIPS